MTVVIGTAGHIDHGKTTLLRALTGTDADRLPEEQRRGLTIDVGYAHASPDGGPEVDYVDVPGHDRLVGNMLVGAGEVDAFLLVVAADDGPRAQTWEHVGLLDALRVEPCLVVVTKADLTDAVRIAAVIAELDERLAATRLAVSRRLAVSAADGRGLSELRAAIAELRDRVAPAVDGRDQGAVRLAVDRAFTIRGRGTVVTGSSRGRAIETGGDLRVQPAEVDVRIRGLHVHDGAVEVGPIGGRVAVNVAGASTDQLARGQVLVSPRPTSDPRAVVATDRVLVVLHPPAHLPDRSGRESWPPPDGIGARLHVGTDQADAVVGRRGRDGVAFPDGRVVAMLRLDHRVAAAAGDRFVLRRPAPAGLLAGGIVIEPRPSRGRSRRRQTPERLAAALDAVAASEPAAMAAAALALHGMRPTGGRPVLASDAEAVAREAALAAVQQHHEIHPAEAGMPLPAARAAAAAALRRDITGRQATLEPLAATIVERLVDEGELARQADLVRLPGHQAPPADPGRAAARQRLVSLLDVPAPPSLRAAGAAAGCDEADVRELARTGAMVVVEDDLAWSRSAFDRLASEALTLASAAPLTPAALRDATGSSRKYVMALLEELDRRGILRRTPAGHVRGPRAPREP